jgi:hypothetical protein
MHDSYPLPPRLLALLQDMPLDELAFTPVPVREPARQQAFILWLALCGCVARAAKAVGKTKAAAYRLRERAGAESFAAAWQRALVWGRGRAVEIGVERALLGEEVPVMYRGRRIDTRRRHDNRLLIAVLNATGATAPDTRSDRDLLRDFQDAVAELERHSVPTENKGFSRPT